MKLYDVALGVLRSGPVTGAARRLTRDRIRILAYHGVPDAEAFSRQMHYLASNFEPVDEVAISAAIHDGVPLPSGAAWVTFDDGDPSVVENGLPVLSGLGIPATMFVCPGLIESGEPFWWRVTDWAAAHVPHRVDVPGGPVALTEYVKTIDDDDRRSMVSDLLEVVEQPLPLSWRQLSDAEVTRWIEAGMALGNHSWDHPCLDRCSEQAQRQQIERTHEWLAAYVGSPPRSFAYPNGNFSAVVDAVIGELGYELAVLYDNRLTALDSPHRQLSRVMLEADQPVERLIGVLSGAQPVLDASRQRLAIRARG